MTGASVANVTVAFSPAGPFSLASGASQDVVATVSVGSAVATGSYDLSMTATSAGAGSRKDVQVIGLNVLPDASLSNQTRLGLDAVSLSGSAQVSPSFWACPTDPDNLWVAYLTTRIPHRQPGRGLGGALDRRRCDLDQVAGRQQRRLHLLCSGHQPAAPTAAASPSPGSRNRTNSALVSLLAHLFRRCVGHDRPAATA